MECDKFLYGVGKAMGQTNRINLPAYTQHKNLFSMMPRWAARNNRTTTDFFWLPSIVLHTHFFASADLIFSLKFEMRYLCSSTCGGKGRQARISGTEHKNCPPLFDGQILPFFDGQILPVVIVF
jgi:hypothetical protein